MKSNTILLLVFSLILTSACHEIPESNLQNDNVSNRFLKPPLPRADVPFESFKIMAELGDTLVYTSGSVIIFPPNSLVDQQNNIVEGEVVVKYREFIDPVDFFLSGVPMTYDSAGTTYTFESSGMCEIYAHQNGQPVFVNNSTQPEINLMSYTENEKHNLYYLDTTNGSWINRGKDENVVTVGSGVKHDTSQEGETIENQKKLTPPIQPIKASGDRSTFDIAIEPGSTEELQVYDKMKFEFVDAEAVDPSDTNIEYSDVRVDESDERGVYIVTFSEQNSGIENSYLARPVFEGKDYEKPLAVFETKQKEYERLLVERKKAEHEAEEKFEIEKARIERINKIIRARNAEIEAQNQAVREENKRLAQERARIRTEQQRIRRELKERQRRIRELQAKNSQTIEQHSEVVRTFQIEQFGIWNCDEPLFLNSQKLIVDFVDKDGIKLDVKMYSAVYKDINGIRTYYNRTMEIPNNNETMIWTILNERFAYVSYADFAKSKESASSGQHTFTLTIHPDSIRSRNDIRMLAGI